MKILILQLARLGDIYMSWPALRALRRRYPKAEINLLTRPRFESAVQGLTAIDHHFTLNTGFIIEPLLDDNINIESALDRLGENMSVLKAESYDWVINLTFSPLSSFITHALASERTRVSGYTRHEDGYFKPADDISSYFYAQVGINKPNRVHLTDIFASMLDIDYVDEDWAPPKIKKDAYSLPANYIVMHVGASESHKSLRPDEWLDVIKEVCRNFADLTVVLIGASSEDNIAREILRSGSQYRIVNLVGKTKIDDLFGIIKQAEILVGCDSAPIHIASLTNTATLNLSLGNVNFWETGPRANLSFVLRFEKEEASKGKKAGSVLCDLMSGIIPEGLIVRTSGLVSYIQPDESNLSLFKWRLIQAIYLNGNYPMAETIEFVEAAMKLSDVNNFLVDQINLIPKLGLDRVSNLIERGEEIIQTIAKIVPEMSPLIQWYNAEKIRIPPSDAETVRLATLEVHQRFSGHLRAYILEDEERSEGL